MRRSVLFTRRTLPEDGCTTTMLAPSWKSCTQKQLSGIEPVEFSVYNLVEPIIVVLLLLLLLLWFVDGFAAAAAVVDLRLERNGIWMDGVDAWTRVCV